MHSVGETEEPINITGKRRKQSDVWLHFEVVAISSKNSDSTVQKVEKVTCKGCSQYLTKSKGVTASTFKRHIVRCPHLALTSPTVNKRKRSNVWAHIEEVETSSRNNNGTIQRDVKLRCKVCNSYFTKLKGGITSTLKRHIEVRHPHIQQVSSQNEGLVTPEVSETDRTSEKKGTKRRSNVWTQFEEVTFTEEKQKGLNLKVKKLRCKKCKKLFTKPKDGCTTTLKRNM